MKGKKRWAIGFYLRVLDGPHKNKVGVVIGWDELGGVPRVEKATTIRTFSGEVLVVNNDNLEFNFERKPHWRKNNGSRDTKTSILKNHNMLVIPDPKRIDGYGTIISGLLIGVEEDNPALWSATKHRLRVNAGCGAITVDEYKVVNLAREWVPVSGRFDVPKHIRDDFMVFAGEIDPESIP